MKCTIKNNIKKDLISNEIIDVNGNLLDSSKFEIYKKDLQNKSFSKYGLKFIEKDPFIYTTSSIEDIGGISTTVDKINYNDKNIESLNEAVLNHMEVQEYSENTPEIDTSNTSELNADKAFKIGIAKGMKTTGKTLRDLQNENADPILEAEPNKFSEKYNEKLVELKTAADKLSHYFKKINVTFDERIKGLNKAANNANYKGEEAKAESILNKVEELKQNQENIQNLAEKNIILAALEYAKTSEQSLNYLNKKLEENDMTNPKSLNYILEFYANHVKSFSTLPEIKKVLNSYKINPDDSLPFDSKDIENALKHIERMSATYTTTKDKFIEYQKEFIRKNFNKLEYFPIVEKKWEEIFKRQYKDGNLTENRNEFIARQFEKYKEEIQAEIDNNYLPDLLEKAVEDIGSMSKAMGNGITTNNRLIGVMMQKLQSVSDKITELDIQDDSQFIEKFGKLVSEKGKSASLKTLYDNILEKDSNGRSFLKGEFSVELLEAKQRQNTIIREQAKLVEQKGEKVKTTKEYKDLIKEYENLTNKYYTQDKNKNYIPKDKYKNNLKALSATELEMLDFFKQIIEDSHKTTYGQKSLKRFANGMHFYELPKIRKSKLERMLDGSLISKSNLKETWEDLTKINPDDVGYVNSKIDAEGNPILEIPIHYRDTYQHRMDPKHQSLDLFSIFRLERKNSRRYEVKKNAEMEINTLLDVARSKPVYTKKGNKTIHNKELGTFNYDLGSESNIYKMLNNMVEQQFYDIANNNGIQFFGKDANKLASYVTGLSSFLSLTFNVGQGVANITNTQTQLLLESLFNKGFIKRENVLKANKLYAQEFGATLSDNLNPVDNSLVNQINEFWNIRGYTMGTKQDYLKNTMLKHGMSREVLQIAQSTGEHWIQSTIAMSTLDAVKVMDKKGNFIDKNGKLTSEDNAASVLDMMVKDKNGRIKIHDSVVYTSHTKGIKWKEGGRTQITKLVSKKILEMVGNYKQDIRADIYRNWYGKIFGQYRKYFWDMGLKRFKGIQTSHISKDKLRDDQLSFNDALKAYEEGTYTSFIRYTFDTVKSIKDGTFKMKEIWGTLTEQEQANVLHASTELAISLLLLMMFRQLVKASFDDDDKLANFTLYQMRRLESEIAQFYNVSELFKIIKSPIPSAMLIEDLLVIGKQTISNPFEEYEWSHYKGENKLKVKTLKKLPGLKEWYKDYQSLYSMQNNLFGVR